MPDWTYIPDVSLLSSTFITLPSYPYTIFLVHLTIRSVYILPPRPRENPHSIPSDAPQHRRPLWHPRQTQTQRNLPDLGPRHRLARNKYVPLLKSVYFPAVCQDLSRRVDEDGGTFEYVSCRCYIAMYELL